MNRHGIVILVNLGAASAAFALQVAFHPVMDTGYGSGIGVMVGTARVWLTLEEEATIGGMDLFITVADSVTLSNATTIGLPGGIYTAANTAGEAIDLTDVSGGARHASMYTFANQQILAPAGAVLAAFDVRLPAGTLFGTKFRMENTWNGVPGSLGGEDMQIIGVDLLSGVPEPAAGLLLMLGATLVHCRRSPTDQAKRALTCENR